MLAFIQFLVLTLLFIAHKSIIFNMKTTYNNHLLFKILLFTIFLLNFNISGAQGYGGLKTIVIDAGHGGKDPGCRGGHTREKDVTLAIALKLGEFIEKKYPDVNVIYTRKTDVFVELDERAKIANRNKADLFICIHANAGGEAAYGVETYVLGLHRTEAQQKIAERENSAIQFEENNDEKYKDIDLSVDAIIARQLQLSVFLDHSIMFASMIQKQIKNIGRKDRGVKQAGFLVLYKTTMPSVLIETGFLSNKKEERFLRDTANQTLMAQSFFKAFKSYKDYYEKGIVSTTSEKTEKYGLSEDEIKNEEVIFRVQIETSTKKIPKDDDRFKGLPVWMYENNGLYKYTVGAFKSVDKANELKKEMRKRGFEHAFVVAFYQNERINLEKAIKLAKK
ncbi:MAG TPA: N-acetylmuramoyl-L-alanine amidase [Crocinitomix sp.]|nr:N-acetylmuramoyl-L-alanine amidase [Crocinitomix sp.]